MIDRQELLDDIINIINALRPKKQRVLTVDIIRQYQGNYYNANTSPKKSWNAKFGKFLKENQDRLGIREVRNARDTRKGCSPFQESPKGDSPSLGWEVSKRPPARYGV